MKIFLKKWENIYFKRILNHIRMGVLKPAFGGKSTKVDSPEEDNITCQKIVFYFVLGQAWDLVAKSRYHDQERCKA